MGIRRAALLLGMILSTAGCGLLPQSTASAAASRFEDPGVVALVRAAAAGDEVEVRRLRESRVDIEAHGWAGFAPLLALVHAGSVRGIDTALAAGADAGVGAENGATVLHLASARPETVLLKTVLDRGFNPSTPNTVTGGSPMRPALHSRRDDAIAMLLDRGTDVNLADRTGHTPHHNAAMINRTADVRRFLAAGADPKARTVTGTTFQPYLFRTPDHILLESVKRDRRAIEQWLTERGIPVER